MAKPNNSFYKVNTADSVEHEIVPRKISDGTYVATPPTMSGDTYIVTSKNQVIPIPDMPVTTGGVLYQLTFTLKDGLIQPIWVAVNNTVFYSDNGNMVPVLSDGGIVYC